MPDSQNTNTFGWDTVAAIPVKNVNQGIAALKAYPQNLNYQPNGPEGLMLKCDFDSWKMNPSGKTAGQQVEFVVSMKNVEYYQSDEWASFQGTWEQLYITFWANLQWVKAPDEAQHPDPNLETRQLKVSPTGRGSVDAATYVGYSSSTEPKHNDGQSTSDTGAHIGGMFCSWLRNNMDVFNHVFATINVALDLSKTSDPSWNWCKPTDTGYAYLPGTSAGGGIFAVLTMTGGRTAGDGQAFSIDEYTIPSGAVGGYLISIYRFFDDMILPNIQVAYPGSSKDLFDVIQNQSDTGRYTYALSMKSGRTFYCPRITKNKNGNPVDGPNDQGYLQPVMTALSIDCVDNTLVISTATNTQVEDNIVCTTTAKCTYSISLDTKTQFLKFSQVGNPVVSHTTKDTTPGWEKVLEDFILIVAAVVVAVLTDGAAGVVAAILVGIVMGTDHNEAIEGAIYAGSSPNATTDFVSELNTHLHWPLSDKFELTSASLNGPLQLGFKPHFRSH